MKKVILTIGTILLAIIIVTTIYLGVFKTSADSLADKAKTEISELINNN